MFFTSPSIIQPAAGGKFVAACENGTIGLSRDGITWTINSTPFSVAGCLVRKIAFGGGRFVAVGNSGTTGKICYSPDGVTWTDVTPAATYWYSVTYGNGMFMAVSNYRQLWTSPDGVNWTNRNSYLDSALPGAGNGGPTYLTGIEFDKAHNTWILTGQNSTNNQSFAVIARSTNNGATWTNGPWNSSAGNQTANAPTSLGPHLYATLSTSGNGNYTRQVYETSDGGANWNYLFNIHPYNALGAYDAVNGIYLLCCGTPRRSTNGTTFASVTPGIGTVLGLAFGNNLFVVGDSSGYISTSPDGNTWTSRGSQLSSQINFICFGS